MPAQAEASQARMPWVCAALVVWVLGGCTSLDPYAETPIQQHLQRQDDLGDCARLLQALDHSIDAAGVRDAQSPRVRGLPYLRIDRTNAGLAGAAASSNTARAAWVERLRALDREARTIEVGNAPDALISTQAASQLEPCTERLIRADQDNAQALLDRARVDDHYSDTLRAAGLYALTRIPFAAGVRQWQNKTLADHASTAPWPPQGATQRYAVATVVGATTATASVITKAFTRDPLGLPQLDAATITALFEEHAPILDVQTLSHHDHIGAPVWADDAHIEVNSDEPVLYTRLSHALLDGRWLPQLIYTFWFPSRPRQASLDLLAGRLDGIIWRVTLGEDLRPLLYDSIHPCGCYHLFYPTPRLRARAQGAGIDPLDEGLFVPQHVDAPGPGQRALLRIAAQSHYLQRVLHVDSTHGEGSKRYRLRDENVLRQLPLSAKNRSTSPGPRSLYGPDGMVAGTERLERFLFWPMGIASAGQMRQWGHHATAFVGRRHFDDPHLLQRYFEFTDGAPAVANH
jgi:hypothetical protein